MAAVAMKPIRRLRKQPSDAKRPRDEYNAMG